MSWVQAAGAVLARMSRHTVTAEQLRAMGGAARAQEPPQVARDLEQRESSRHPNPGLNPGISGPVNIQPQADGHSPLPTRLCLLGRARPLPLAAPRIANTCAGSR